MKRIVIIANESNGLYVFRGMLITELIKLGHQVTALIPFDTDVDNLNKLGVDLIETPIDRRGINLFSDFKLLLMYRKLLCKIKPDIVITYTIKPNIYGGIVSRFLKISYAVNITGLGTAFEGNRFLRKTVVLLYRTALKKAKVIYFENNQNRDVFIKERITNLPNTYVLHGAGVDLDRFSYCNYPDDTNEIRFLFMGRIMKDKGMNELLQAMSTLIKKGVVCSLDILGMFEEQKYRVMFNDYSKEGWLRYHGNQADVRPFIERTHCFVLPSYHEGMANTNLECAASGRPIITSNIPGCKEAVIDGVSGFLCEPKNVHSLYKAMRQMAGLNREERQGMGKAGRKHIEELFDKRKVVMETIDHLL